MVGIIQCSRIYCKRMSSKGLTSIGRRVDDAWRRVVAEKKTSQNLDGAWQRVDGAWWRVAASKLLQKLAAEREGSWWHVLYTDR
jgi:hypothetical protein